MLCVAFVFGLVFGLVLRCCFVLVLVFGVVNVLVLGAGVCFFCVCACL